MAKNKKLISNEFASALQDVINNGSYQFKDTTIFDVCKDETIILHIDKIGIRIFQNSVILDVPSDISDEYYKAWRGDVASIVLKDVKKNNLDLYKEVIVGDNTLCLLRLIDVFDDRVDSQFSTIVINEARYIIIKAVQKNSSLLSQTQFYDSICDIQIDDDNNEQSDEPEEIVFPDMLGVLDDNVDDEDD